MFGIVCKKCSDLKPVSDYYISNLNKCKECVKKASKQRTEINISTPEGLEKERKRHRDKYYRLNYKEKQKIWDEKCPWKNTSTYKNLRKYTFKNLSRDFELHHWNYNTEYLKDVFILYIKDHKILHNHLTIDINKRLFYLEDGTYLDTKEKHEEYIKSLNIQIYK